jgi:hypothetical protein
MSQKPAKNPQKPAKNPQGWAKNPELTKNLLVIAYIILALVAFGMLQDDYCR